MFILTFNEHTSILISRDIEKKEGDNNSVSRVFSDKSVQLATLESPCQLARPPLEFLSYLSFPHRKHFVLLHQLFAFCIGNDGLFAQSLSFGVPFFFFFFLLCVCVCVCLFLCVCWQQCVCGGVDGCSRSLRAAACRLWSQSKAGAFFFFLPHFYQSFITVGSGCWWLKLCFCEAAFEYGIYNS